MSGNQSQLVLVGRTFPILLWYWIFLAQQGQEQGQDGNKKSQGGKKGRTFSLLLKGKGVCYIHTVMFNLLGINSICPGASRKFI